MSNFESVIKMRDGLKGGKNLPVKVYSDNNFVIVDESAAFNYTKWDDENGILYVFRLSDFHQSRVAGNWEEAISVAAINYEFIQVMEVAPMPLKYLDNIVESIKANGVPFSDEFKESIRYTFESALHKDRWRLSPDDVNNIHGVPVKGKDEDDYYHGKFAEPFKETVRYRDRNQQVEDGTLKPDNKKGF